MGMASAPQIFFLLTFKHLIFLQTRLTCIKELDGLVTTREEREELRHVVDYICHRGPDAHILRDNDC